MKTTMTISSKGQVTIPSYARKKLGLQPQDKLDIVKITKDTITIQKPKSIEDYFGKLQGVLPDDAVAYIRELRDR